MPSAPLLPQIQEIVWPDVEALGLERVEHEGALSCPRRQRGERAACAVSSVGCASVDFVLGKNVVEATAHQTINGAVGLGGENLEVRQTLSGR